VHICHTLTPANFPQLIVKALVALYGSILFWVGAWTILDTDTFTRSLQRDLSYTFIGLLLMIAADSFYSNAGIDGRCLRGGLAGGGNATLPFAHTLQLLRGLARRQRFQKRAVAAASFNCLFLPCRFFLMQLIQRFAVHGPRCSRKKGSCGADM